MIEVINAKVGLGKVIERAKLTLEEIEKKAPNKTELIEKQKDSIKELQDALYLLHKLDIKCMSLSSDLHSKNRLLLEMQLEINKLEQVKINVINNAEM